MHTFIIHVPVAPSGSVEEHLDRARREAVERQTDKRNLMTEAGAEVEDDRDLSGDGFPFP